MSFEAVFSRSAEQDLQIFKKRKSEHLVTKLRELKVWLQAEQNIEINFLEYILLANNCNVDEAKEKLQSYFKCKQKYPEIFTDLDPLSQKFQNYFQHLKICPLPSLTNDLCRIILIRFDGTELDFETHIKFFFAVLDLGINYDTALTNTFVLDCRRFQLKHCWILLSPGLIKKVLTIAWDAYADRIQNFHLLYMPRYANPAFSLMKSLLSSEYRDRLQAHDNLQTLYESIPKDCFPSDYGGQHKTFDKLFDNWRQFVEDKRTWLINN